MHSAHAPPRPFPSFYLLARCPREEASWRHYILSQSQKRSWIRQVSCLSNWTSFVWISFSSFFNTSESTVFRIRDYDSDIQPWKYRIPKIKSRKQYCHLRKQQLQMSQSIRIRYSPIADVRAIPVRPAGTIKKEQKKKKRQLAGSDDPRGKVFCSWNLRGCKFRSSWTL